MNTPPIPPESTDNDPIDTLVRDHQRRLESQVDPQAMLSRVHRAQRIESRRRHQRGRLLVGLAATIIAVVTLWMWDRPLTQAYASPERLVEEARLAHAQPIDRRYRIITEWDDRLTQRFPMMTTNRTVHLWTRSDRFWIEATTGERRFVWGRDEQNRVWMAPGPRFGLLYDADEVSEPVHLMCELFSLEAETLLGDMLRHFQLMREIVPDTQSIVITAVPRFPMPRIKSIRVELDPEGKFVRKLELERLFRGEPAGKVQFIYEQSATLDDSEYTFAGHLNAVATILDRTKSRARDLLAKPFWNTSAMPPLRAKDAKELPKWKRERPPQPMNAPD